MEALASRKYRAKLARSCIGRWQISCKLDLSSQDLLVIFSLYFWLGRMGKGAKEGRHTCTRGFPLSTHHHSANGQYFTLVAFCLQHFPHKSASSIFISMHVTTSRITKSIYTSMDRPRRSLFFTTSSFRTYRTTYTRIFSRYLTDDFYDGGSGGWGF